MQESGSLSERLEGLAGSGMYPFHMPGHKRMSPGFPDPYSIDITEIEGFDDLHYPSGVLRTLEERWRDLYGAGDCILSVGGSTVCNLAGFFAAVSGGDLVIAAANCHKSIYNAMSIHPCNVRIIEPPVSEDGIFQGLRLSDVEEALASSGRTPALLVLTHPTYEGMLSELSEICSFCHDRGIAVMVDAAHGAHFGLDDSLPESPVALGADVTVMSLHKTLPAFTMSACIAVSKESLIDADEIRHYMHCFETSSPSYILMSGMERCINELERIGANGWKRYAARLDSFYDRVGSLSHITLMNRDGRDPGKLLFAADGMTGKELADRLRSVYSLETEMHFGRFVLAMTSVCDTDEGFGRLVDALVSINDELMDKDSKRTSYIQKNDIIKDIFSGKKTRIMSMFEATSRRHKRIPMDRAAGAIAGDLICIYPPGVPFVVPGEVITAGVIDLIYEADKMGYNVTGTEDGRICCVVG